MKEKLVATIRLKKSESIILRDISWSLTKQQITTGKMRVVTEADIVHMLIEKYANNVNIDENGDLCLKDYKKNPK